jgi:DUF1707 SHOCT-like domain
VTEPEQSLERSDAVEPGPPPAPGVKRYRLSDGERNEAISALGEAFAQGRLDADEFGDRMSRATEARLAADLVALFADLPHQEPAFLVQLRSEPGEHAPTSARDRRRDPASDLRRRAARAHRPSRDRPERSEAEADPRMGYAYSPHPIMMMPLIVLILAATNLWFFLPLLFVCLSMASGDGRRRRELPGWRDGHPPRGLPRDPRRRGA